MPISKYLHCAALLTLANFMAFAQGPTPELWYFHHSLLNTPQAVQSSEALIDRAYSYGYRGVAFWDVSFEYIGTNYGPYADSPYLRQAMNYAVSKGMKVMAPITPYGYSNDLLEYNPQWAEAQRIVGAEFQVNAAGNRLQLINSFPGLSNPGLESGAVDWFDLGDRGVALSTTVAHTGNHSAVITNAPANGRIRQSLTVKPWRQYHLKLFYKSSNFSGYAQFAVFDVNNFSKSRVTDAIRAGGTRGWTELDYTFNSQDSTDLWLYAGVYGGNSGSLWLDDVQISETALVYVTRGRPGTPLSVYDLNNPSVVYTEGSDYNHISDPKMTTLPVLFTDSFHTPPVVTLPKGTRLKPGQTVGMNFYAAFPAPGELDQDMCLTDSGVWSYLAKNAQAIANVLPRGGSLLLGYDEMRQMNSCATCRAKNMTPAQLLDWHVQQTMLLYQSLIPNAPMYVWSDMFDPYHNAVPDYYYAEGDLTGSWTGLPAGVTIMNWNLGNLVNSLTWFSGMNPNQTIPHQQIIAGYYDSGNGAASARREIGVASGIPGLMGLMYTSWNADYSQLQNFANAAIAAWPAYLNSLPSAPPIVVSPVPPGQRNGTGPAPLSVDSTGQRRHHAFTTPGLTACPKPVN